MILIYIDRTSTTVAKVDKGLVATASTECHPSMRVASSRALDHKEKMLTF